MLNYFYCITAFDYTGEQLLVVKFMILMLYKQSAFLNVDREIGSKLGDKGVEMYLSITATLWHVYCISTSTVTDICGMNIYTKRWSWPQGWESRLWEQLLNDDDDDNNNDNDNNNNNNIIFRLETSSRSNVPTLLSTEAVDEFCASLEIK